MRITCGDNVLRTVLLPKLTPVLREYPDITLEFDVSYGFRDIVADRFDAGVRLGRTIDKDMIAVPIGPPLRMAVVGSPDYFERHPRPKTPQDLTSHPCINQRMPTSGGLYVWDFERRGRKANVRVDGPLIFNTDTTAGGRGTGGAGNRFVARRRTDAAHRGGKAGAGAGGLVPQIRGLSLVLPEPKATLTSILAGVAGLAHQ